MGTEQPRFRQTDPDGSIPQRRIFLLGQMKIINLLVRPDVHGADDDGLSCQFLRCFPVCPELLLLRGHVVVLQIKKFAAKQTDTPGIVLQGSADVIQPPNVGIKPDAPAVPGGVGLAPERLPQPVFFLFLLLFPGVCGNGFCIRIDAHCPGESIHNGGFPLHGRIQLTQPHHRLHWIRAGIFMVRARMAVWEFSEPRRVRNARIFSLSSWTVSLGVRSSATRITGSRVSRDSSFPPLRQRISRLEISTTSGSFLDSTRSAARACMYSSVMVENI